MRNEQRREFSELVTGVMSYYSRDITPTLLGIYWNGLQRFELEDVERAFNLHAQDPDHGQFPPKIADITRLLEGSTQTQSMRAWEIVERALRTVGQYQSVCFDDPIAHAVIAGMGGWCALCRTPINDMPFRAREFERSYAAYRARREVPPYPAYLIGVSESENRMQGYQPAPPVLIGDPQRAKLVMERATRQAGALLTRPQRASDTAIVVRKVG